MLPFSHIVLDLIPGWVKDLHGHGDNGMDFFLNTAVSRLRVIPPGAPCSLINVSSNTMQS